MQRIGEIDFYHYETIGNWGILTMQLATSPLRNCEKIEINSFEISVNDICYDFAKLAAFGSFSGKSSPYYHSTTMLIKN